MRSTFLLFLLSWSCHAQQFIKGGLSFAHTTAEPPYGAVRRNTTGLTVGFLFNRQLSERTFFRPEIAFVQKGERVTTSTEELKARLNYVEASALLALSMMKEPHTWVLLIEGGPSFGYGLGGNYKVTSPGNSRNGAIKFGNQPSGTTTNDVYLDSPLDIGLQFGFAAVIRNRLLLDLRYGTGLTSFTEPPTPLPAGTTNTDFLTYNRTLQFTVGWGRNANP